tara:strand:- start:637 stop:873 length:237 start_codon:yes stop_codon:yes gene_type:complete
MGNVRSEFNRKKKENEDNMIRSTSGLKKGFIKKGKKKKGPTRKPMKGGRMAMSPEERRRRLKLSSARRAAEKFYKGKK